MLLLRRRWAACMHGDEDWCRYGLAMPALPRLLPFVRLPGPARPSPGTAQVKSLAEDLLIYLFADHFYHEWLLQFVKWFFSAYVEMIWSNGFSFLSLLICWITVIDFWTSSQLWIDSSQTVHLLCSLPSLPSLSFSLPLFFLLPFFVPLPLPPLPPAFFQTISHAISFHLLLT